MRLTRLVPSLALAALGVSFLLAPARAEDPVPAPAPTVRHTKPAPMSDRLFLAFAQDAAIVPSQWWEGQIEFDDGSSKLPVDVFVARAVVAFQPFKHIEVGGRVGFGNSSASGTNPDGTGATDLDAYAKYFFGNVAEHLDMTAGLLLTVPTGDDTAGLGFNSFSEQIFGAVRYRLDNAVIGGHLGIRFNGDGDFQGSSLPGKTSYEFAGDFIFPTSDKLSVVAEVRVETERFEGQDSIVQLLGGVNWKVFGRGMLRGAIGGGVTDAAPNFTFIASYAYTF